MHIQRSEERRGERLAQALGWFSVALGTAELVAPRRLANAVGVRDAPDSTIRAFGAREIVSGIAILARPDRAGSVWSRVGGDALDISYLTNALSSPDADRRRVGTALAVVAGVTALDVICARQLSNRDWSDVDWDRPESLRRGRRAARRASLASIEEVVTINLPVEDVYRAWKEFETFPRFMKHVESVQPLGDGRWRWRAKAPAGTTVEWIAEVVQDTESELISWRSVEGSQIENSGIVRFRPAPGARGTELQVHLEYRPPAGRLGRSVAWLFGEEPEQQMRDDLRRFKQLMETGEIPISDGMGQWRPARPAESPDEVLTAAGVRS